MSLISVPKQTESQCFRKYDEIFRLLQKKSFGYDIFGPQFKHCSWIEYIKELADFIKDDVI